MDAVRDDIKVFVLIEEDAMNHERWRAMICCGNPLKGTAQRKNSCGVIS